MKVDNVLSFTFVIALKVTVDLQGCLPKSHLHARRLCYNHRKVCIIVKLIKFKIRRNIFFLRFDFIVSTRKPSNAKLVPFAKLNYLPSCSRVRPNKLHYVGFCFFDDFAINLEGELLCFAWLFRRFCTDLVFVLRCFVSL